MLKALLLIILAGGVLSASRRREERYDMECECGRLVDDEDSRKDCEESAKLEDSNQATKSNRNISIF